MLPTSYDFPFIWHFGALLVPVALPLAPVVAATADATVVAPCPRATATTVERIIAQIIEEKAMANGIVVGGQNVFKISSKGF